jgi:hypothetical protein
LPGLTGEEIDCRPGGGGIEQLENDVDVQLVKGGVLELSVHIDRQKVIKTNPLWYPLPGKLVNQVRGWLNKP